MNENPFLPPGSQPTAEWGQAVQTEVVGTGDRVGRAGICAACGKPINWGDSIRSGRLRYCRACFDKLRRETESKIDAMETNINYPFALVGAGLGGIVGMFIWWITVLSSHYQFGIVAILIGIGVGQATLRFAGNKRSQGLQAIAAVTTLIFYVVARYLINLTYLDAMLHSEGISEQVPVPPVNMSDFFDVMAFSFGVADLIVMAVMTWAAWRTPRPVRVDEALY